MGLQPQLLSTHHTCTRCLAHAQPKVDTLFALPFKGGQQLEPVRAELYNDRLVIYRHDLVYEDVLAHNVST